MSQPSPTTEELLRDMLQEIVLTLELWEGREVISLPRDWLQTWQRRLITVLGQLLLQQTGGRHGA